MVEATDPERTRPIAEHNRRLFPPQAHLTGSDHPQGPHSLGFLLLSRVGAAEDRQQTRVYPLYHFLTDFL